MSDEFIAALDAASGLKATAGNIERVSRLFGGDAARWAFRQHELRKRARAKFVNADNMFFTREGLEQATQESVAHFHASRFPEGAIVADLTCGIGSDLRALADRGPAIGFEIDEETRWCATQNAPEAKVVGEDCLKAAWTFDFAFADPARRDVGRRTLKPDEFRPNPSELATRFAPLKFAGMKLSPMLPDEYLQSFGVEVEFVSFRWECLEAVLWFGGRPGVWARSVDSGATLPSVSRPAPRVAVPGAYIAEADPAAIRAHCLPSLCAEFDAALLGDSNGYLTCSHAPQSPWLRCYPIFDTGSFDTKRVRAALRALDAGRVVVKSRAPRLDALLIAKSLQGRGAAERTVLLFPVGKSIRYAIAGP